MASTVGPRSRNAATGPRAAKARASGIRSRHGQRFSRRRRRHQWRYRDKITGKSIGRSEGLALASLDMFARGVFSANAADPLRVDAAVLRELDRCSICAAAFRSPRTTRWSASKAASTLLRALGTRLSTMPPVFARNDTPGPADCLIISSGLPSDGRDRGAGDSVRAAAPAWTDLAVAHDAWRHSARRLLAASGADDSRRDQRIWCRCTNYRNGWPIR